MKIPIIDFSERDDKLVAPLPYLDEFYSIDGELSKHELIHFTEKFSPYGFKPRSNSEYPVLDYPTLGAPLHLSETHAAVEIFGTRYEIE